MSVWALVDWALVEWALDGCAWDVSDAMVSVFVCVRVCALRMQ